MKKILKYISIILIITSIIFLAIYFKFKNIDNIVKNDYIQKEYIVSKGDTLFGIASKNTGNKISINNYIDYILKINNKKTCDLQVNEKIIILIKK